VHALGVVGIAPKLASFLDACRESLPADRTALFAQSKDIYEAHHNAITAGQSDIRESDWEDSDHFLSFVHADIGGQRKLLEMDGNEPRDGPLDRGEATDSLLLVSAHGKPKLTSCPDGHPGRSLMTGRRAGCQGEVHAAGWEQHPLLHHRDGRMTSDPVVCFALCTSRLRLYITHDNVHIHMLFCLLFTAAFPWLLDACLRLREISKIVSRSA